MNMPLRGGGFDNALIAAAYWGRIECVKTLVEAGAEVNLRLENGPFSTALQASQADVSQEDRMRVCDERYGDELKYDKVEVVKFLNVIAQKTIIL